MSDDLALPYEGEADQISFVGVEASVSGGRAFYFIWYFYSDDGGFVRSTADTLDDAMRLARHFSDGNRYPIREVVTDPAGKIREGGR